MTMTVLFSVAVYYPHSQIPLPTLHIKNETGMQPKTPNVRINRDTATRDGARKRVRRPYFQTFDVPKLKQEHMIDRKVVTQKRDRELVRWKYCKDLDVRYFSLKILKDRLQAAFLQSCKEEQCPVIGKRMESHRQSVHGRTLRKGGGLHKEPKNRTCVSIGGGASVDDEEPDGCANNPSSHTCLSKISPSNASIITHDNRIESCPEISGTSHDTDRNIPIRGYSINEPGKANNDSLSKDTCSKTEQWDKPQNFLNGSSRLHNETHSCNTGANKINEPKHFLNGCLRICNDSYSTMENQLNEPQEFVKGSSKLRNDSCGTIDLFTKPNNSLLTLRNDSCNAKGNQISLSQNSESLRNSFGRKSNKDVPLNLSNGSSAHRNDSCSTKAIYVDAKSNYNEYIALDCINGIIDETITFNRDSSKYNTKRCVDAKKTYPSTSSKHTEYTFNDRERHDYVDSKLIDNELSVFNRSDKDFDATVIKVPIDANNCLQNRNYANAIQNYNQIDLSCQTEKYVVRNDREYCKRYADACVSEHVCYEDSGIACNNSYDTNAHVHSLIYVDSYTEPCQSLDNNKIYNNGKDVRKYLNAFATTFSTSSTEPIKALNFSRNVLEDAYKTNSVCKFGSLNHSNTSKSEKAMPFINKPTQTTEVNKATMETDTTQKSIVDNETTANLANKYPYPESFKSLNKKISCSTRVLVKTTATAEMKASAMSYDRNFKGQNKSIDAKFRICVINWLRLVYSETVLYDKIKNEIAQMSDYILARIVPLLYQNIHKNILKAAILNLMNDLPNVTRSKTRNTYIIDLAQELTNKLLSTKEDYANALLNSNSTSRFCNEYSSEFQSYVLNQTTLPINPKHSAICCEITKCFKDASVECDDGVIKEASVILSNCYDIPDPAGKRHARNAIINLLVTSTNLSEDQSCQLAKVLMRKVRKTIIEANVTQSSQTNSQPPSFNTVSVYTAVESTTSPIDYPVTSTPIKKRAKKIIQRLNKQEIKYVDDVSKLIRAWINTLPETFSGPDEQEYKEMIIRDLATDISDGLKVEQIAGPKEDKRNLLRYIVCRWVFRLGAFEIPDVDEQINVFLNKLDDIPVPVLTQPQHGNRQQMASIKFTERKGARFADNFIPKGTDIIEDQISIWMNEQSSDMFIDNDKKHRQDNVHNLAQVLENNLGRNRPETEVLKDIAQWLSTVVRPEKRIELHELTEKLTDRVIRLPQDETLATDLENRVRTRKEELKLRAEMANIPKSYINDSPDHENTTSVFISNFIEHHYDIDDPLAKRAFNRLLHSHLLRLSPPTRKEVYDNFEKKEHDDKFPLRNMIRELEYIKDISDWLKNLPVDGSYNTLGNRERTDFVNSLAISIREIEEDREKDPHAMDYDIYMVVMIGEHLKLLPLVPVHLKNAPFMVDQLYRKIIAHRVSVSESIRMNESINTTSVNPDNIGDFIEEFIRINGADIANDEIKMEVWAVRLIREIKKIVQSTSSILSKAEVYEKLADVHIPSDETAKYFNFELDYVTEITNWMKNLPFLPMSESEKDNVTNKICELAEKITETFRKLAASPNDMNYLKNGLENYVSQWVSELPYDKKQNVVLPVATQQLIKRVEKVKQNDTIIPLKQTLHLSNSTSESTVKSINSMESIIKSKNNKITSEKSGKVTLGNIVNAIEKWTQSLPIKAKNNDAAIDVKNEIFKKLCEKVGELNMNRSVYDDDILYATMLNDEIDINLNSLPQSSELQIKKDALKADLINTIIELKNKIKEKTAGDTYKLTLEKTIDDFIPYPVSHHVYDPGFELYKDRLATMFILENFDHGTDAMKTRREQSLKNEIDKYFEYANIRNAIPLSKDQLYGELYSNLFKVPVPNEASVKDEVEKLKTRGEIDKWFEELPLREVTGLNELHDWDKMLTSLAIRVHDIEISDSKPENKIIKVIIKFLSKFQLQPGNENRVEEFAKVLQKKLKSTAGQRKFVIENPKKRKNKVKSKSKKLRTKSVENQSTTQELRVPEYRKPKKNTADEIYDIIQTWCNELPLRNLNSLDAQTIKDDLTTKMMIKITEINNKPEVFGNDVIYEKNLDKEIEHLLLMNPISNNLGLSKIATITKLKKAITSIKPQIEEERAAYNFKQDLSDIVDKVLEKPQNILCNEKAAFVNAVKNNIVDDFILYKYSNDNDEDKQRLKLNIQENVSKFTSTQCNIEKNKRLKSNILMKTNELLTELAKISPQSNSIVMDEVEEIRMKQQVSNLFEEIHIPGKEMDNMFKVNYLKESLAKKLNEMEYSGHSAENEMKMKNEIEKCLHKLKKDSNPSTVDAFITTLKNNETARRMPRNIAPRGPDSLEDDCRGECYTNHETKFQHSDPCHINTEPRNFTNNKSVVIKKYHESVDINVNFGKRTCGQKNIEDADSKEDEGFVTSDESLCLCEKSSIKKRRNYCFVPVGYFCDGCKGYNSIWYKMPLTAFF